MRKKSRNNKIPKNSLLFLYVEKEEEDSVRFHELRLSADSCTVYQRWGRTNKQVYRANKKSRHASKEDALAFCASLRTENFNTSKGWLDKAAPPLPKVHR
jgi:predicted DNA-binding WGR domain protein